ncbi:glycoside hydrolase family 36 protein [Neptunicella marina]|uniref:Alpha-galactosidase n=1 Tax=Neptunicella marina TaxID=2125989 RepID=A0A8J6IVY4_9ALTE|nr:glycoside hydrolase family 36 protein [Neptunicella marina]MBC3766533.1 alpha-galactosidase [Neptunicella marina]
MQNKFHLWMTMLLGIPLFLSGCATTSETQSDTYKVGQAGVTLEFNQSLQSRVISHLNQEGKSLGDFGYSEYVLLSSGEKITDFNVTDVTTGTVDSELGHGQQTLLTGQSAQGIRKSVSVQSYPDYPDMLFVKVSYTNTNAEPLVITQWVQNAYQLKVNSLLSGVDSDAPAFWAFQGASHADRRDWVMPLIPGYSEQNYMGMNASDYGSGTPLIDVWRKDVGLAVGHLDLDPQLVSLPVSYPALQQGASLAVEFEKHIKLMPGETLQTLDTFVAVHHKDYYATLVDYRKVMAKKGLVMADVPDAAYEPIWCAWGYERDFSVEEVEKTLPKAKQLGLEWAVLDDGWQTSEGDWYLDKNKFPNGDKDMKALVDKIKAAGLKAKLWWAPLAVDPGTDLLHDHSDMLLLDQDGAVQDITWWNSFYLCPAYSKTRENAVRLVKKIIGEWGYAGLKIDGQHLNGVPPCYNPAHHHASPQDSVNELAEFWKLIYDTAIEINPDAVVEICPCGTSYAFHNLPYMNQTVSSDPLSSWQVRSKGKTLKGLMGPSAPYYGDHVELSDNASDFASSFGIGAVLGSKFTLPSPNNKAAAAFVLDAEKEKTWQHWFDLYNKLMLPKGEYLGDLYDIGFDYPETHVVRKDGKMFYAFYAPDFDGTVEFRGLQPQKYRVVDYVNNRELATVSADPQKGTATLATQFKQYLLVELIPLD